MKNLFLTLSLLCVICVPGYSLDTTTFQVFEMDKFLEVKSTDKNIRCEDLKIQKEYVLGITSLKATINLKNLSKYKIQSSFHIVLFDKNYNFIASGMYESIDGLGGFEPREANQAEISFGKFDDFSDVKYYQCKVFTKYEN